MARQQPKPLKLSSKQQSAFLWIGIAMIGAAGIVLLRGQLHFAKDWGGTTFAPFVMLIGGLLIFLAYVCR